MRVPIVYSCSPVPDIYSLRHFITGNYFQHTDTVASVRQGKANVGKYDRILQPSYSHRGFLILIRRYCMVYIYIYILTWWHHQMETFSALLAICRGNWRGALMFPLICTRINGWVNNDEVGDLRRHRAHCNVTVMETTINHRISRNCEMQVYIPKSDMHLSRNILRLRLLKILGATFTNVV